MLNYVPNIRRSFIYTNLDLKVCIKPMNLISHMRKSFLPLLVILALTQLNANAQSDPCAQKRSWLTLKQESFKKLSKDYAQGLIALKEYDTLADEKIRDIEIAREQLSECERKPPIPIGGPDPDSKKPGGDDQKSAEFPGFTGTIKNINGKTYILYPNDKLDEPIQPSGAIGISEKILGSWVIKSGPGVGTIDSNGTFGIKGEKIWYLITFRPDRTGVHSIHENNKINKAGERTTFAWKRNFTYAVEGTKIKISLEPGELITGSLGTWTLPQKSMKVNWELRNDSLDIGKGWIARPFK